MDQLNNDEKALAWSASWNPSFEGKAIINSDFSFRSVNHQFCKILGVTPAELVKNKFSDMTPEPLRTIEVKNAILVRRGDIQSFLLPKSYVFSDGRTVDITLLVNGVYHPTSKHFMFFVATIMKRQKMLNVTSAQSPKWIEWFDLKKAIWTILIAIGTIVAVVIEKLFTKG